MRINSITALGTGRPNFGAVSVSGAKKAITSPQNTDAIINKLKKEMDTLVIREDNDTIRRTTAIKVAELKEKCEQELKKVSIYVAEKGFFESQRSFEARQKAAKEQEELEKKCIQAVYDKKIEKAQQEKDDKLEAILQRSIGKAARAKEIVEEVNAIYEAEDAAKKITMLQGRDSYETTRAASMKHKGFDRLAGYEEEKNILYKYFIKEVRKKRAGEEANIPSSMLFFGPRGMGKTKFYKALAEESECNEKDLWIHSNSNNYSRILEELYKKAEEAKSHYEQTGNRSIIFIDEITHLADNDSTILKDLSEFLRTCSEKYHCTVFAATNYPEKIALPMEESQGLFPIRVLIDPPTQKNKMEIIKFYIQDRLGVNTDIEKLTEIIGQKEKNDNRLYTINRIKDICTEAGDLDKKITIEEFIEKVNNTPTNITKEQLKHYHENYDKLVQNIIREDN